MAFLLTVATSYADEVYIEGTDADGNFVSGYVDVDESDYVEGFVESLKGRSFFIEGEFLDNIVYDSFNFYDAYPEEESSFNQMPEFEDGEDFFE